MHYHSWGTWAKAQRACNSCGMLRTKVWWSQSKCDGWRILSESGTTDRDGRSPHCQLALWYRGTRWHGYCWKKSLRWPECGTEWNHSGWAVQSADVGIAPDAVLSRASAAAHPHASTAQSRTALVPISATSWGALQSSVGTAAMHKGMRYLQRKPHRIQQSVLKDGESRQRGMYQEKCKSTIGCSTSICIHVQLIASFPWTPVQSAAYSQL